MINKKVIIVLLIGTIVRNNTAPLSQVTVVLPFADRARWQFRRLCGMCRVFPMFGFSLFFYFLHTVDDLVLPNKINILFQAHIGLKI